MSRTEKRNSQYRVTHKRPMDLTKAEQRALKRIGYALPLSARIGRGPMVVLD